jgi:hypothetical protein
MSSAALLQLLPDFGPVVEHGKPAQVSLHEPVVEAPPRDIGQLIAEAVAEAEAALEARLTEAHQSELAAVRQANADDTKAFLEAIGTDVGTMVTARMDAMAGQLIEVIGAAAARSIGGVLSDHLQERSLQALSDAIKSVLENEDAVRIRVQGPASLFEKLSAILGERAANLDFTEAPGFDLSVAVDNSVIETRMSEWSLALTGILS